MCKYWWYEWKRIRPNVTWTVYGWKESLFHSNLKSSNSGIHHYVFHDDPHRHDDEELKYQKTEVIDCFQIINGNHILYKEWLSTQYRDILPKTCTTNKVENPNTTHNSCTNPGTDSLLFSLSRISKTHTYSKVPAARA